MCISCLWGALCPECASAHLLPLFFSCSLCHRWLRGRRAAALKSRKVVWGVRTPVAGARNREFWSQCQVGAVISAGRVSLRRWRMRTQMQACRDRKGCIPLIRTPCPPAPCHQSQIQLCPRFFWFSSLVLCCASSAKSKRFIVVGCFGWWYSSLTMLWNRNERSRQRFLSITRYCGGGGMDGSMEYRG